MRVASWCRRALAGPGLGGGTHLHERQPDGGRALERSAPGLDRRRGGRDRAGQGRDALPGRDPVAEGGSSGGRWSVARSGPGPPWASSRSRWTSSRRTGRRVRPAPEPPRLRVQPGQPRRPARPPPSPGDPGPQPHRRGGLPTVALYQVPNGNGRGALRRPPGPQRRRPPPESQACPPAGRTRWLARARSTVTRSRAPGWAAWSGQQVSYIDAIDRRLRIFNTLVFDGGHWVKVRCPTAPRAGFRPHGA